MRRPVSRRLQLAGISSIGQLAAAADDQIKTLAGPGVTLDGLRKQRVQAEACCVGRPRWRDLRYRCLQDVVDAVCTNAANADTAAISVPLDDPDTAYVHFDIEGDPFVDIEYLFGYQLDVPGRRPRPAGSYEPPRQLWAESPTARHERQVFEDFLAAMEAVDGQFGSVVILHYASYEVTRLQQLARRYPTSEDGRDNQVRVEWVTSRMLDLYKVARRAFYLPFPSYSIKDVAPGLEQLPAPGGPGRGHAWLQMNSCDRLASELARHSWSGGEIEDALRAVNTAATEWAIDNIRDILTASAAMSVFWYQRYCDTGQPVWRFLIEIYNADDLKATQRLFDYLIRLERRGLSGVDDGPPTAHSGGGA
jgi:predicted RecB family nuclease